MLGSTGVSTPAGWLYLAKTLTDAVYRSGMTDRTDCIVQIADDDAAEKKPIAWHVPATSDIVLNARKIKGMGKLGKLADHEVRVLADRYIKPDRVGGYGMARGYYRTSTERESILTMMRIRGVLAHEAAHSRWSHWLLEPWAEELARTDRLAFKVMMQLEEVRIESAQVLTSDDFRRAMRFSARMIMPTREDLASFKNDEGKISVFKFALNSVLTLGRADQGVLNRYEVADFAYLAEDIIGSNRLQSMRDVWNDFSNVQTGDEELDMLPLAEEFLELFKKDSDSRKNDNEDESGGVGSGNGSGNGSSGGGDGDGFTIAGGIDGPDSDEDVDDEDGESVDLDLDDLLGKALGKIIEKATENADTEKDFDGRTNADPMEAKKAAEDVFKKKKDGHGYSRGRRGDRKTRPPRPEEHRAAAAMARELEKLSVHARSLTQTRSLVPPGRLHSRGAVQQAAERAQGRATTARPWARTQRRYSETPKLTVGVMTDVSGSMSWATQLVASLSWITSKAVRHVNGTVAATVFGERAEPILGPNDALTNVTVREACDGSEAFNEACAALDGVLRLTDATNGVRILFVVSDGFLVAPGEMAAAAAWVEKLIKSGVVVIWVTDSDSNDYGGFPTIPKGVYTVKVEGYRPDVQKLVQKLSAKVTEAFAGRR